MGKGARNRNQRIVTRGTGITIQAKHKYHNEMPDPGEGQHLWTVVACWKVTPNSEGYNLDTENLLTIEGPGCFKCEQTWSLELAAKPCEGSVTDIMPDVFDEDEGPFEPGGQFGDGMK